MVARSSVRAIVRLCFFGGVGWLQATKKVPQRLQEPFKEPWKKNPKL